MPKLIRFMGCAIDVRDETLPSEEGPVAVKTLMIGEGNTVYELPMPEEFAKQIAAKLSGSGIVVADTVPSIVRPQ
jgi:hypothetical protein